jgi:crotonobetainyl-CoA:carnitine CoA-transferase CaiB-like acyl-CoA transferase
MSTMDAAWHALGEDPSALALVRDHGDSVPLRSALPVGRLVHDAIATASLSAALLAARRTGSAVPTVELDPLRVATAVTSERHFRLNGEPVSAFAELSGFWPASDGWVRTHANYPHHRQRLLEALELPQATSADELLAHLNTRPALEIERLVTERGGIAAVVRTEAEWRAGEQAVAVAAHPLVSLVSIGEAPPSPQHPTDIDAPARGVRVLDLTRVVAGPVATRTLALWGADVLRIDPPRYPEIEWQHLDSGAGKRSALIDFDTQRDVLDALLEQADVVVTGYRPGALDHYGLSPAALADRRPGIIVARLSAWGTDGPFGGRRGFDSIVQAATGIAAVEGEGDLGARNFKPGAMPAQALDHAAGYLLAAGITSALRRRLDAGGSWLVETSLAGVSAELLARPRKSAAHRADEPVWTPTVVTRTLDDGAVLRSAASGPHYDGGPDDWVAGPVRLGSSMPHWLPRE